MPSAVNNVLYNIVAAYNRKEIETARKEKRKEENIVLECCEVSKIKASQIFHKIISTHPLTVLIISVITHIEQRKEHMRVRHADSVEKFLK